MAAHYWIKLYQDILRDPKMGRLPDSAWRRCIELFLLAGEQDARDGVLPDLDDMAWQLRITREQLDSDLEILSCAGIVTLEDGQAFVTNFERRQSADGSTERWRRWRDRQREKAAEQTPDKPKSNDGKQQTNDSFADTDKNRIDTEQNRVDFLRFCPDWLASPPFLNQWGEWLQYHTDNGRPLTEKTAKAQLNDMGEWGEEKAVEAMKTSIKNGWKGLFEPKSSTNGHPFKKEQQYVGGAM